MRVFVSWFVLCCVTVVCSSCVVSRVRTNRIATCSVPSGSDTRCVVRVCMCSLCVSVLPCEVVCILIVLI